MSLLSFMCFSLPSQDLDDDEKATVKNLESSIAVAEDELRVVSAGIADIEMASPDCVSVCLVVAVLM